MSKIIGLKAENFKKLQAIDIKPDSNVVKLTGKNKQGKSSVLDALACTLGGSKMIPEHPIRNGESSAIVEVDLGDYIVTRKFTELTDTLVLKSKEGAKYPSPQAMLDSIIGKLSFDPLKFINEEKKQVETLLSVVEIPLDYEKLRELSGLAIQPKPNSDPLIDINTTISFVKQQRTEVNRDLTRDKKTLESYGTPTKTEPVIISELFAEKERLTKLNDSNNEERRKYQKFQQDVYIVKTETHNKEQLVERLKNELAEAEKALTDQYAYQKHVESQLNIMSQHIDTLKDPDFTEINAKIESADKTNAAARKYKEYSELKFRVEEMTGEYKFMGECISKIEDYKESLLAEVKFPIKGLGFADGLVTYNGLPLSSASSAEKLSVSLAMGMALNPDLKVIILREASLLDDESMAIIEKMAYENDFQVWMEIVDSTGTVGLYLEDGTIKNNN